MIVAKRHRRWPAPEALKHTSRLLPLLFLSWLIKKVIVYNKLYLTRIWLVLTYYLLEERRVDDVIIKNYAKSLSHKTNRFHVAVRLSSNWSKKTLKYDMAFVKCHHFFPGAWLLKTRSRCWGYSFTNILQEFVRVLRGKKTRHVLWIN